MFKQELVKAAAEHRPYCPACESTDSVKNGKQKGAQTYQCKACGTQFNSRAGTTVQYLKKQKLFLDFCQDFANHGTVRHDAAKYIVSKNTIMSWRKKFYSSISQLNEKSIQDSDTISLMHEPIQVKGQQLLTAKMVKTAKNIEKNQNTLLVLCHDEEVLVVLQSQKKLNGEQSAYRWLKKQMRQFKKKKEAVPSLKKRKSSSFAGKKVSDYLFAFYDWTKRFRGLSTKYRQCYLNWFRYIIEGAKEGVLTMDKLFQLLLHEKAYPSYKQLLVPAQVRVEWVSQSACKA